MKLDVAVVGGGVSGCYSAWRLQQAYGKDQSIALFEYSDRIGGRLFTVTLPGMPNVHAEVGGMRFIPDDHVMVNDLVNHLKLPTKDFPMGAPEPVGANCNLYYLRGKHLRLNEINDPEKVPYRLNWSEQGLGPEDLQARVMNYLFPNMNELTLCEQMKLKVYGKELWKYGFWNLLYRVLSNEGYQFMRDAGGYDANVANSNAVTQLPATEYKDTTEFLTLRDGYDKLPITLAEEFNEKFEGCVPKGERVYMNHRLAKIDIREGEEYRYKLTFYPTKTANHKTTAIDDCEAIIVEAKKIVLGMPRRSLELIDSEFFNDEWLQKNIPSVLIQKAFKIFLAYEQPWWRSMGLVAGRSVTDLPVRQVFYFGTESEQKGGEPYMNSLMMASYNDISTVPFWKGLEEGDPFEGHKPACMPEDEKGEPIVPKMEHQITDEMVRIANEQVAEVHAQKELPPPYSAVYHDWSSDPYGGGWHEWKANYRLDEIMCRMRHPVDKEDIYIVGSAYSYEQGWVEGALDTAESTLQEFFGLSQPDWITVKGFQPMPVPCPGGCGDISDHCIPSTDTQSTLDDMTPNCIDPDVSLADLVKEYNKKKKKKGKKH